MVGRKVRTDEQSLFFDARKKNTEVAQDTASTEGVITISLLGLCAETRKPIVKCDKVFCASSRHVTFCRHHVFGLASKLGAWARVRFGSRFAFQVWGFGYPLSL